MTAVITVRGLATAIDGTPILCGIDLMVHPGEVLAVIGPSGSGKTTFLRALNYLTPFTAGEVEIAGHRLRPGMNERADAAALRAVRVRVGMVFQSFHLFPHLTALANVMEAPRLVGEVLAVVGDLAAAGQTMVIVTHELGFARRVAGRVAVLAGGRVVENGPPGEVLERPRAAETRALLGMSDGP